MSQKKNHSKKAKVAAIAASSLVLATMMGASPVAADNSLDFQAIGSGQDVREQLASLPSSELAAAHKNGTTKKMNGNGRNGKATRSNGGSAKMNGHNGQNGHNGNGKPANDKKAASDKTDSDAGKCGVGTCGGSGALKAAEAGFGVEEDDGEDCGCRGKGNKNGPLFGR